MSVKTVTGRVLASLIGQTHTLVHHGLPVRVTIEDARVSFGRIDVLVQNADPEAPQSDRDNPLWVDVNGIEGVEL